MKSITEHYNKLPDAVVCELCPNFCTLKEGATGKCLTRKNDSGQLVSLNYGKATALALDPIEKKPLYHFFPGKKILSIGSWGCNLNCPFCQNSEISQFQQIASDITPEALVNEALLTKDNIGVAFTYNEPSLSYEFIFDTVEALKNNDLKTVLVTNAYLNPRPWKNLCKHTDAMNIDLKAFNNDFYKICGGDLEIVKQNIITAYESGLHLELTNLVVTDLNDKETEFEQMVSWIASISKDIPFHISRYFPSYKQKTASTNIDLLKKFATIATGQLNYVYCGNVDFLQDTKCPNCKKTIIERKRYSTIKHIKTDECDCQTKIAIII